MDENKMEELEVAPIEERGDLDDVPVVADGEDNDQGTGGLVIDEEIPTENAGGLVIDGAEGIDSLIQDASNEAEFSHFEEEVALNDAPPPDLSQVGKRMDTEERWYVLHTFSGYESVAEDNLKKVVEKYKLQDRVKEIFIPTEDTIVERRGKKVIVPTKLMQNYIFVKMLYGDDLWHTITRTRGITGFAGPKGRPLPLSAREVVAMKLERKVNISVKIEEGDTIQVIDGPLAGQTAAVKSVDAAAKKCTVEVNMFGRPTSVELSFAQVKKI